jgi:hypothetical protein
VTGFEDPIPPTPQQLEWLERLEAWTDDERERLGLGPEAEIPITALVAREVLFQSESDESGHRSVDKKGASRSSIRRKLTELAEKGLLRKLGYGQWVIASDRSAREVAAS